MEINETMINEAKNNATKTSGIVTLAAGLGIAVGALAYRYAVRPVARKISDRITKKHKSNND